MSSSPSPSPTPSPSPACTVNNPCGTTPPGSDMMCLTVKNTTSDVLTITQIIQQKPQSNAAPCFTVNGQQTVNQLLPRNSAWHIVGSSGTVYYEYLNPQQQYYTAVISDYTPAPVLDCSGKPVPDKYFFIIAGVFAGIGLIGSSMLKQSWQPTSAYTDCLTLQGKATCQMLHPQSRPYKTFGTLCLVLAVGVIIFWLLVKGPVGKLITGEAKYPISCAACQARGSDWQYTEPSTNDGDKGFILTLRKLRCKYGGNLGPCMCFNSQDRQTCFDLSQLPPSPAIPDGLNWQADIANIDFNKMFPSSSPSSGNANICACCTSKSGQNCVDVETANYPQCSPFNK